MRSRVLLCAVAIVAISAPTLTVGTVEAGSYPGNKCASDKIKAMSSKCKAALSAYSKYVGGGESDSVKRDDALAKAAGKMTSTWVKAETKSASKGANCVEMTATDAAQQAAIDAAVLAIYNDVRTGLTLSNKDHAKCGATLIKEAGALCAAYLKNQASYVGKLAAGKGKRDAGNTKADDKFTAKVTDALAGCPTTATLASIEGAVDGVTDTVITDTIISPNVDDSQFTTITPATSIEYPGVGEVKPRCSFNTAYHFFVKKGTVNKLVMYYQGGGACWSTNTCITLGTFDNNVNPAGSDNPNNTTTGFGDLTNPLNPFKDWNIVFVPYCTGDIHFGDNLPNYGGNTIFHKGWHNSRTAEKWAREHFVAPDDVFVTGSSAGAYGAFFNAPLHIDIWPSAQFSVLADAGNGIITPEFLNTPNYGFDRWKFEAHLPTNIPGIEESIADGTGIPAFTQAVATFYPNARWAHYTSSYDGGTGGQTGFYNVMLNSNPPAPSDNVLQWVRWWDASCDWNSVMRDQAIDTAALIPTNYRYYIGTGSRHTMYGSDKVYTDTTGNVPTIVDWVNAMLTGGPGWTNVECDSPTSCGTVLPGDPVAARECEGGTNDGASCSNDSACPGGVCGYEEPFSVVGPDVVISCP